MNYKLKKIKEKTICMYKTESDKNYIDWNYKYNYANLVWATYYAFARHKRNSQNVFHS